MSGQVSLRVCQLYPREMSIYADRGNILFLRQRCLWRGIGFELTEISKEDALDQERYDLFYIGGGQDRDQLLVAEDLVSNKKGALTDAKQRNAVILAVCGGYQLLGHSYELPGRTVEGIGLADLRTVREPGPRLIGNITIDVEVGSHKRQLSGFENHGGRTYLGSTEIPLGQVTKGFGNNGKDGYEGVRSGNLFGTYLHGPLLPKNAWFADHLIEVALSNRYGEAIELDHLDDEFELGAHSSAVASAQ